MLATCGMTSNTLATTASRGTVALVMQTDGPNADVDKSIRIHLEGRGFTVRMLYQDTPASNAGDVRLVILSSTISAKQVGAGWRELAVPLLTWENDLLDDLAMTGKRLDTDYGESRRERFVWLVNAPHPVAAGLPAGATNVYRKQAAMNWGKPDSAPASSPRSTGSPRRR
jgi:hypothetical protein